MPAFHHADTEISGLVSHQYVNQWHTSIRAISIANRGVVSARAVAADGVAAAVFSAGFAVDGMYCIV